MESTIADDQRPIRKLAGISIAAVFVVFSMGRFIRSSCTIELEEKSVSPDSRFTAVSWVESCGGAASASYGNVSIFPSSEARRVSELDRGNVFECDSSSAKATWVDNQTLRIESFQRCGTDSRAMIKDEFSGIRIVRQFNWKDEDVFKD